MRKFISFDLDPLRPINLGDSKKWQREGDTRVYKLVSPDLDKDRQFATAEFKVVKKQFDPESRLEIAGIANAAIVDRVQEKLDPVGLDITNYSKNRQLLAHHSYYHPIGQVEDIKVQDDGVYFTAWIGDPTKAVLTDMQREIRSLVAQGILKTVSVGFIPKKIRAPLFSDSGEMLEPTIIEAWELLELSVVAIPCNQDSVFQVRGYASGQANGKVKTDSSNSESLNDTLTRMKNELAESSMVVQTLIFSKSSFSEEQAKDWVEEHGFTLNDVYEEGDSFKIDQVSNVPYEEDSVKIYDVTEGVKIVSVKPKNKAEGDAPAADAGGNENEMLMLVRSMSETMKQVADMCKTMMQKMDADASEDQSEDNPPPAEDTAKAADDRIANLEKTMGRMSEALAAIAKQLKK